ncbi:MAG TPA: TonB C-terminal domain-containing protein, partial [Polyangia bacterium]|nr:TonB C-terminal domain-containing protein [Polyangia bacterium]
VRFGKPRDLSFLPHKEGHVKDKPPEIKVAKDMNALPHLEDKKDPKDIDPLKKTHAEVFKQMQDDTEGVQPSNEGSLTGSRAGTAAEAKGDPYILSLIDQIGTAWTVPTTLKDAELANLSADVCLTIADSGALTNYSFVRKSGNSQFDSSLDATLSMIKKLPPPPDRWRSAASRGRLCPSFSKQ